MTTGVFPLAQQQRAKLRGFYIVFSKTIDKQANKQLHALATAMLQQAPKTIKQAITNVVPSYTKLYIEYDSSIITEAAIRNYIDTISQHLEENAASRTINIEVNYNGEDLASVAAQTGLSVEEVIQTHTGTTYQVFALGFSAGFPFLGSVPEKLQVPRLATPRAFVPAHSVAIANAQTGVYATGSPGGWNILGHTLEAVYDPSREQAFALEPGDQVNFIPAQGSPPPIPKKLKLLPSKAKYALFKVLKSGIQDIIVDAGRFLVGGYGLVRSGYLDTQSASIANKLLNNSYTAPQLEMHYQGPKLEVLRDSVVAFAGHGMQPFVNGQALSQDATNTSFQLNKGDILSFPSTGKGKTAYLAVCDGFESDSFLGSCSVDTKGSIGQTLQIDDILGSNSLRKARAGYSFTPYQPQQSKQTIISLKIHRTNLEHPEQDDYTDAALAALCREPFTVMQSDRMGIRFDGETVPGGELISEATQLGAFQISPSGMPLLLLVDRGTLGGYSKPAVLAAEDLPKVAQLIAGQKVQFKESI